MSPNALCVEQHDLPGRRAPVSWEVQQRPTPPAHWKLGAHGAGMGARLVLRRVKQRTEGPLAKLHQVAQRVAQVDVAERDDKALQRLQRDRGHGFWSEGFVVVSFWYYLVIMRLCLAS